MPGFSLTLLLLPRDGENAPASANEIVALLDEPCDAPGWSWTARAPPTFEPAHTAARGAEEADVKRARSLPATDPAAFDQAIHAACDALLAAEREITRLDSIAGDGDCGITLRNGAEGTSLR